MDGAGQYVLRAAADATRTHRLQSPDPPARARGGKAFIVLPSTAKGDTISRIVPLLSPGTHVSTSKNDIHYVVTEYGVAQLRGKSAKQRAQELIAIAHPDFRGELMAQARGLKLV